MSKVQIVEGHGGDATGVLRFLQADGQGQVGEVAWEAFVTRLKEEKGVAGARNFLVSFMQDRGNTPNDDETLSQGVEMVMKMRRERRRLNARFARESESFI